MLINQAKQAVAIDYSVYKLHAIPRAWSKGHETLQLALWPAVVRDLHNPYPGGRAHIHNPHAALPGV